MTTDPTLIQIAEDVGATRAGIEALHEKVDMHIQNNADIHKDQERRLRALEGGRARLLGALAVIAPLAGAAGALLMKKFGG